MDSFSCLINTLNGVLTIGGLSTSEYFLGGETLVRCPSYFEHVENKDKLNCHLLSSMLVLSNPESLYDMAAEMLASYVRYFTRWTIMLCNQNYQEPCRLLQEPLIHCLPCDRARDISVALVRQVAQCYSDLKNNTLYRNACAERAPLVLKSVLHPSVKRLECIRDTSHPSILEYYKVTNCDLLYKALSLLRGLKDVSLGPANRTDDMSLDVQGFRDTLEKFASRSCRDSDLEMLANNCKRLRYFDISHSSDISDAIVEHILRFEHMDELNLCEVSFLSEEALGRILKGFCDVRLCLCADIQKHRESLRRCGKDMAKDIGAYSVSISSPRSQRLKIFGCAHPRKQRIDIIAQFSNLTSISLSQANYPLTPLRDLEYLISFKLSNSRFMFVSELLIAIRNRLKCLNIVDVFCTDYDFLRANCVSLICLHLCFKTRSDLILLPDYCEVSPPLPDFPKVEFLQLYIRELLAAKYILFGFKRLRRFNLQIEVPDYRIYLEHILDRGDKIYLGEVFWKNVVIKFYPNMFSIITFHSDGTKTVHNVEERADMVLSNRKIKE